MELGQGDLRWRRPNGAGSSEPEQVLPEDAGSPRCDNWKLGAEKEGYETGLVGISHSGILQRPWQPHQTRLPSL